jgi:cell division septum initiation protein DivIVA
VRTKVIRRVAPLAVAGATVAVLLQGGVSQAQTVRLQPSIASLVAEAKQLSNEVDTLGQQYDSLRIQIANAKTSAKQAKRAASEAEKAMAGSQQAVSQLAAMGYMSGGMDPTLQMLTSGDPVKFLNQASTVEELDNQAGERLTTLQTEQLAAVRAQLTAKEQSSRRRSTARSPRSTPSFTSSTARR